MGHNFFAFYFGESEVCLIVGDSILMMTEIIDFVGCSRVWLHTDL